MEAEWVGMTFALLLLAYLFSQFFRSFLTIIAADLTRDLGFGPGELGWVVSAWFIAFALSQFPVGYLLDTVGPRRTMGGLMLVGVVGAILFAISPNFSVSVLGMALVGVGCSPMLMASLYIFGRTEPPERFAMLAAAIVGFGNIGNLISATPLAYAAQTLGWRWSMAGVGLAMAGSAVLVLLFLRDPPKVIREDGAKASMLGDILTVIKIPALWFSLPLHLISYGVVATERGLWLGPFLSDVHAMNTIQRGNVALAMSLGMAFGALACGPASRWLDGPKMPAVIGNAITVFLLLLLGFATQIGAETTSVLLTLVGFFGLTYSLLLSHGRQFFPDYLLGRGVTCLNFLAIGGAGLLQAGTGLYMKQSVAIGTAPVEAYSTIHLMLGFVLAVALLVFLKAPAKPANN
jgi:MFS family permease